MERSVILNAFLNRKPINFCLPDGRDKSGVIASLEHEDGSGYSFNILLEGEKHPFYYRANKPEQASIIRLWEDRATGGTIFARKIEIGSDNLAENLAWLANYLQKVVTPGEWYIDPHAQQPKGEIVSLSVQVE